MRQKKSVREAGPYLVESYSQGSGMVYFQIYPAFPRYDSPDFRWAESRYNGNGGGPSIFSSIATARILGEFLNSVYPPDQVADWEKRILAIQSDARKQLVFVECRTCGTLSSVHNTWNYCPVCGNRFKKKGEQEGGMDQGAKAEATR